MRNLGFYTLGLALVGFLAASQANATTVINVTYKGGSTLEMGTGGTEITAAMGDTLIFDVNVQVDAAGMAGLGFDVQWSVAQLNNTAANWQTGTVFTSFAPTTSTMLLAPTNLITNEWGNLGFFGLPPFPTSTNVFLGTLSFQVSTTDPNTVMTGFFATDGSSSTNGMGTFITPDFTTFSINAPAPGASLSMFAGLAALAGVSLRRSRRSEEI